jgi:hypothetical protein
MDPVYVAKCEHIFRQRPERPYLELFIPEEYRKTELVHAVYTPIWRLEVDVIWPLMAQLLSRDGVRGDLLEFGVFAGYSFRRLVEIFRPTGLVDRYYGFDSFRGLPPPDPYSVFPAWSEGAFSNTSKEGVLAYLVEGLGDLEGIELVEGWFSDTLPTLQDRITRVAFVRVDCDLYSSTTDVFNFLSGRLVDGAMLYFDDWTHDAGTGETKAFFEFAEREADRYTFERILTVSDGALAIRVRVRR